MQFCRLIYPCSRLGSICKFGRDGKPDLEREWWLVGRGGMCDLERRVLVICISSNSHCIALSLFGQFMSLHHSWSGVGYMHLMWLQIWHISATLHVMSCISTDQLRNWRYGCKNWKKHVLGQKSFCWKPFLTFFPSTSSSAARPNLTLHCKWQITPCTIFLCYLMIKTEIQMWMTKIIWLGN